MVLLQAVNRPFLQVKEFKNQLLPVGEIFSPEDVAFAVNSNNFLSFLDSHPILGNMH